MHDEGVGGQSDLSEPVAPFGVSFLTGVDLHLPVSSPPAATMAVVVDPRLGDGRESICTPNWPSSTDRISIQLNSYHHLLEPDGSPAPGRAAPACAAAASTPPPPAPAVPPAAAPPAPRPAVAVTTAARFTG